MKCISALCYAALRQGMYMGTMWNGIMHTNTMQCMTIDVYHDLLHYHATGHAMTIGTPRGDQLRGD